MSAVDLSHKESTTLLRGLIDPYALSACMNYLISPAYFTYVQIGRMISTWESRPHNSSVTAPASVKV